MNKRRISNDPAKRGDFIQEWDQPGVYWQVLEVDVCPHTTDDNHSHPMYKIPAVNATTRWVCDYDARKET